MTTLVLGPVRSGKSLRAHALARGSGRAVTFAATAAIDPLDDEMTARVARHRADRPADWTVVETAPPDGTDLARVLREAPADRCVVVDALGTWLAARMMSPQFEAQVDAGARLALLEQAGDELVDAVRSARADLVLVGEETGWGVVPASALGRLFRDALGRLVQRLAAIADRVELVVAGYAVDLRAIGRPVDDVR
jgi:adenosylcobinamide kinase / adenosylcobinamide-phosphate guanylyltransferase